MKGIWLESGLCIHGVLRAAASEKGKELAVGSVITKPANGSLSWPLRASASSLLPGPKAVIRLYVEIKCFIAEDPRTASRQLWRGLELKFYHGPLEICEWNQTVYNISVPQKPRKCGLGMQGAWEEARVGWDPNHPSPNSKSKSSAFSGQHGGIKWATSVATNTTKWPTSNIGTVCPVTHYST